MTHPKPDTTQPDEVWIERLLMNLMLEGQTFDCETRQREIDNEAVGKAVKTLTKHYISKQEVLEALSLKAEATLTSDVRNIYAKGKADGWNQATNQIKSSLRLEQNDE